jgi:flagellin-like hook-associated protein FlgL
LQSVEQHLTTFQADLGTVSAEIETLQTRSAGLSAKLDTRKGVEKLLGPVIERISIPPGVVKKISEGVVDEVWAECLEDLQRYMKAFEENKDFDNIKAVDDVKPLLVDLSNKVYRRSIAS